MELEGSPEELPVVKALRGLSIFGANQSGAYREHFTEIADVLGEDVDTRLVSYARDWASAGEPGLLVLTGSAGTGKTAVADAWCREHGADLPSKDELVELSDGHCVVKDLSGHDGPDERCRTLARTLRTGQKAQALVCANDGVLRRATMDLSDDGTQLAELLDQALRHGAARAASTTVVNVNRQRPTAPDLWDRLLDFVVREELWTNGCAGCPADGQGATGCPFRENAAALRQETTREALRQLMRLAAGQAVPTMRETLAILAWAIVGEGGCRAVKHDAVQRGKSAHTATDSYFYRAVGGGLSSEAVERSPLLAGMVSAQLGATSDLQVDEWLRDSSAAPRLVQELAGCPDEDDQGRLAGSRSPSDRVATALGAMTFHSVGETLSTSENLTEVEECLRSLVGADGQTSCLALWRQRVYFEGSPALGGSGSAASRLLDARYFSDFVELASRVAEDGDWRAELSTIVAGLNFLVCGFSTATEGLIVPDQACLFARDPGSFQPARPSLVFGTVPLVDLALESPDQGVADELLDIDRLEVDLVSGIDEGVRLRIGSVLYEAIREAEAFEGPVGQGTAEMTDVRSFYGQLARALPGSDVLRVADPSAKPPSLQSLTLPHIGR